MLRGLLHRYRLRRSIKRHVRRMRERMGVTRNPILALVCAVRGRA